MTKNMEFYEYESIINEIRERGCNSNNKKEVEECISELCALHDKFDKDRYADNDELWKLNKDSIKTLHEHKKELENRVL